MKRVAIISTVVSAVLLVLGLIDYLTNYNWANDQDPLAGNQNVLLNDGATVLIAGGLLMILSVIMWVLAVRGTQGSRDQRQS
jgi:hypothetical protein